MALIKNEITFEMIIKMRLFLIRESFFKINVIKKGFVKRNGNRQAQEVLGTFVKVLY
jgi:hypothetical protein